MTTMASLNRDSISRRNMVNLDKLLALPEIKTLLKVIHHPQDKHTTQKTCTAVKVYGTSVLTVYMYVSCTIHSIRDMKMYVCLHHSK